MRQSAKTITIQSFVIIVLGTCVARLIPTAAGFREQAIRIALPYFVATIICNYMSAYFAKLCKVLE